MQIQVALDFMTLQEALAAASEVADFVDRIECGTSLIFADGMKAVTEFKRCFPEKKIIADLKIVDHGEEESRLAYEAGADSVTIMSCASDESIRGAASVARRLRKELIAELSMHCLPLVRAPEIAPLGADLLCVRIGPCRADQGLDPYTMLGRVAAVAKTPLILAGGVSPESIDQMRRYSPAAVVVGHYLRSAADRRRAAEQLRARLAQA